MKRGVILLAILLLAFIPVWAVTQAQTPDQNVFPITGHKIADSFYEDYYQIEEPLLIYGYPITSITFTKDQKNAQYFSNTRFEMTPEGTVRTKLGLYFFQNEEQTPIDTDFSNPCRLYEETGQKVCHEFLAFFDKYGGVEQFGLPLSPIVERSGRIAQYFEYAILEYRPGFLQNSNVSVADLGKQYFKALGEKERLYIENAIAVGVQDMDVQAFIARDSASEEYDPYLYVIVKNQIQAPVSEATVAFTVVYSDGSEQKFLMEPTNRFGFSKGQILPGDYPPGLVEIHVQVTYLELIEETRTSFRIWY